MITKRRGDKGDWGGAHDTAGISIGPNAPTELVSATRLTESQTVSQSSHITQDQIQNLFTTPSEKEALSVLLSILNSDASPKAKASELKKNIDSLSKTIVRLLQALMPSR